MAMSGLCHPPDNGPRAVQVKYRYTRSYHDRHGRVRIEYRRKGKTTPLPGTPGTAEFQTAYDKAHARAEGGAGPTQHTPSTVRPTASTLRWLCVEWFKSAEFGQLATSTQRDRQR